jgi:hypothetical protein
VGRDAGASEDAHTALRKEAEDTGIRSLEQFVLVDGHPDARFEFIAVRGTCLSDHLIPNMLQALTAAERCS